MLGIMPDGLHRLQIDVSCPLQTRHRKTPGLCNFLYAQTSHIFSTLHSDFFHHTLLDYLTQSLYSGMYYSDITMQVSFPVVHKANQRNEEGNCSAIYQ